jgi:nitrogen-specific signal transduction histidine kinase
LDFSKIEAGKLEMEDIQFSLYDQLEHAVSVLAARANKKGLELACQVDHTVPDQIIGDPGRLFQVFVNLIGNANLSLRVAFYMVNIITLFNKGASLCCQIVLWCSFI